MADKYDELFERYFRGQFPKLIKLRELELDIQHDVDENIGGGRIQNSYSNPVELAMAKHQEDEQIISLKVQEFVIDSWFKVLSPERQQVIKMHYSGRRPSWAQVAMANHIDERTARKWREDFKSAVAAWIHL
ncbi:DUF722 domain-containing protein [Pediococcus pentosaceus]|uniref:DUF722 domain-containing protein n=1 Tax=Pediococcus pentosaceus TaxID=1255 RepID=UPI0039822016